MPAGVGRLGAVGAALLLWWPFLGGSVVGGSSPLPFVAFAGSRSLPASGLALAARCSASVARSGRGVVVGCAAGADSAVLGSLASVPCVLSVCAVGSALGLGFWSGSAPLPLLRAAAGRLGACVSWLAGGPLSLGLRARLARRTGCVVASVPVCPGSGLVAFFGSASSAGSALACRLAAARGLPVLAFACGSFALPLLSPGGSWVPSGASGLWAGSFRWASSSSV